MLALTYRSKHSYYNHNISDDCYFQEKIDTIKIMIIILCLIKATHQDILNKLMLETLHHITNAHPKQESDQNLLVILVSEECQEHKICLIRFLYRNTKTTLKSYTATLDCLSFWSRHLIKLVVPHDTIQYEWYIRLIGD